MQRRSHFWTALVGGLFAALVVTALPAVASQVEGTFALSDPGDPFKLGVNNTVNARTMLLGDAGTQSNLVIRNTGNRSPLTLQTLGNGKPPMIVDSTKRVNNLNTDLLDGFDSSEFLRTAHYDANENLKVDDADRVDGRSATHLIRAAFDATDDADDSNGTAVLATIRAPRPGILIMGGSIDGFAFAGSRDNYGCELTVDHVYVPGTRRYAEVHDLGLPGHTNNHTENCSTDGGQVVDKGTHHVRLKMSNHTTAAFFGASVWVIWVPFDGDGLVPVP